MLKKLQRAFWKALTPDLVVDQPTALAQPVAATLLEPGIVAALGGESNLKSQQRIALTRVRVELHDQAQMDLMALRVAGVPGVMPLAGGVVHLVLGLPA